MARDRRCLFWMHHHWQDASTQSDIVVTRTDGSNRHLIATPEGGAHGLTVDDEFVYWTTWDEGGEGGVYKVARPPVDCD